MNNDEKFFVLNVTEVQHSLSVFSVESPMWHQVEDSIDRTFRFGGAIQLSTAQRVFEPREGIVVLESIDIVAKPGRYRLVVSPQKKIGQRSNRREWWHSDDRPFRGMEKFGDDEWDDRTVSEDVSIAKSLFKDFFEKGGVTDHIVSKTLSVWDQKYK